MAQPLPNQFSETLFTPEEEMAIFASFSDDQLAVLRNFSAQAAKNLLGLVFVGPGAEDAIREHSYHRGKIEMIESVLLNVVESRQQLAALKLADSQMRGDA